MNKRFSVIVPCYKNSQYLQDCIDSIIEQDYDEIELIVAEDGGGNFDADYFRHYIENNKKENVVRYEVYSNECNYGTVKNLNHALKKSTGRYIKLIAADDILATSNVLSGVAPAIEKSSDGCIVGDVLMCDNNLNVLYKFESDFYTDISRLSAKECFKRNCIRDKINAVGVFFRKDFFEKYGLFDERFRLLEDWPTWLKLFDEGGKIEYCSYIVTKRRVGTGVVANNNPYYLSDRRRVWKNNIKKARKKIGLFLYCKSYIAAYFYSNSFMRKIYYRIKKNKENI